MSHRLTGNIRDRHGPYLAIPLNNRKKKSRRRIRTKRRKEEGGEKNEKAPSHFGVMRGGT